MEVLPDERRSSATGLPGSGLAGHRPQLGVVCSNVAERSTGHAWDGSAGPPKLDGELVAATAASPSSDQTCADVRKASPDRVRSFGGNNKICVIAWQPNFGTRRIAQDSSDAIAQRRQNEQERGVRQNRPSPRNVGRTGAGQRKRTSRLLKHPASRHLRNRSLSRQCRLVRRSEVSHHIVR